MLLNLTSVLLLISSAHSLSPIAPRGGGLIFRRLYDNFRAIYGISWAPFVVIPCGVVVKSTSYNRGGTGSILDARFFLPFFFRSYYFPEHLEK